MPRIGTSWRSRLGVLSFILVFLYSTLMPAEEMQIIPKWTRMKNCVVTTEDTLDLHACYTFEEAKVVKDYVQGQGYRSIIVVTSPYHTRRTWLTFKKLFEKDGVKIMMMPSHYSGFRPDDWWKTNTGIKELIIEYQKLIYYTIKYFI